MPERKLSYKVDVDTGSAVSDLERLGKAGGDAGKDIAQGFDQAKSASAQALAALSSKLDQVEQDARGTASAVAAIKANLTVDVDDAKVEGFVSDLKNKMGVAFDDVEQDAKQFAQVLERGVDLSKTTNEIKGVGTALDHTRGEADQSRSVLANLAGNSAQSLGELGGVVGDLGVGVGQLAEYAVDGNIKLENLASVAGPMAGLAAAGLAVQTVFKNLAETKQWKADQVQNYADAIDQVGTGVQAVNQAITETQTLTGLTPADNPLSNLFGGKDETDLIALLDKVHLHLSDINDVIASGDPEKARLLVAPFREQDLLTADEGYDLLTGLTEQQTAYGAAVDDSAARLRFFSSTQESVNDLLRAGRIEEDPLSVLTEGAIKFGQVMVDPVLLWRQLVNDLRDGKTDMVASAMAVDTFSQAMGIGKDQVVALAVAQGDTVDATGDLTAATKDGADAQDLAAVAAQTTADALQAQADATQEAIDKANDMIDASHDWADSQQDFRDATADLPQMLAETNTALANNLPGTADYIDALRRQRDGTEDWIDGLVNTRIELDKGRGVVRSAAQTQDDYAEGLGRIAHDLNADTIPAVAAYYANVLQIPESKITDFEMVLATGDQVAIETFIADNSGTKTLGIQVTTDTAKLATIDDAIQAVGDGAHATVSTNANTSGANSDLSSFRKSQQSTPITIPTRGWWAGLWNAPSSITVNTRVSSPPTTPAPGMTATAAPTATSMPTSSGGGGVVVQAAAPSITVNLQAGVVGNRYDLQRWMRGALRDQQRLGRLVQVPA